MTSPPPAELPFKSELSSEWLADLLDWIKAHDHSAAGQGSPFAAQSYTPAVVSPGGTFTIGNGSIIGRYVRIGSLWHVSARITWGTTTVYTVTSGGGGTGLTISYPPGLDPEINVAHTVGGAYGYDASTTDFHHGNLTAGGSAFAPVLDNALVRPLQPFTWAAGDYLTIEGTVLGA